jgi:PAS domain S-box-containing protein
MTPESQEPLDRHVTPMTVIANPPWNDWLNARLRRVSRILGALIILAGVVVLLGWMQGNAFLTNVIPGLPAMMPWTAVTFLMAGVGLALDFPGARRRVPSLVAVGVILPGLWTLIEYATGWNPGLDRLLFEVKLQSAVVGFPGRMSPHTAICFVLTGFAFRFANIETRHGHRPMQSLTMLAGLIALHAVIGHSLGVKEFYGSFSATGMAIHTAILFLLLTLGLLFRDPDHGLMALLTGNNAGSALTRRLLPAAILLPILLAWLNAAAQRAVLCDASFGAAAVAVATMLGFGLLIWRSVRTLERLDQRRRETEEHFHTMADSIPQLAWMARSDGDIFWYNRRWYDYTGTTLDQMKGWGWQSVHDPSELPRVLETIRASFVSGEPWDCTFPIRRHDGVFRWHLSRMLPTKDEHGRVLLWFGSNTDITEQREAAALLEQAKEAAEAASGAKSEFLANMSHEIRTPMNGILGMTELTLATDLNPSQRENLELVKSSADALLVVINDILDFSKIEAGKLDLEPIPFPPRDVVTETLRIVARKAHDKGLELVCRIDPDVPESVVGDPGRLRQILINLIGNAIKFTERGEVVVTVERVLGEDDPVILLFSVADSGIGIPEAKRSSIFDAFEQADGSTTRKYGGTGLGLSISSRLVELMQGRIWVQENPGGGSLFRFTARLERDTGAGAEADWDVAGPVVLDGLRVLIVDDDAINKMILEEILSQWGCRYLAVGGGPEALRALDQAANKGEPFALILLDLVMPEMDGSEVAGRVRAEVRHASTRILMLTSSGPDESGRFENLGIGGWLDKPIRQSELLNAILDLLAPRMAPPPPARPEAILAPSLAPVSRLRVLLVEDQWVNQKVATRMLGAQGHEVTVAANGRLALEALASSDPFDVVLMDIQMPEMDGFEAIAAIRSGEQPGGDHLLVVALTAHAMAGDRERCLRAGFDDYLSKPIYTASLADVLGRVCADGLAEVARPIPTMARPVDNVIEPTENQTEVVLQSRISFDVRP